MCSISNPIVRLGRVLSFSSALDGGGVNFDSDNSRRFSNHLANYGRKQFLDRIARAVNKVPAGCLNGQEGELPYEIIESGDDPVEFANGLIVVKFGDLRLRIGDQEFLIGTSATVCQGTRKSKVWSRVSCEGGDMETAVASRQFDFQNRIADEVCTELSEIYHESLTEFLSANSVSEDFHLKVDYAFLVEAGDYSSDKLFDSITSLRETANLFVLHDEGDWGPLGDLFRLSAARMDETLGIAPLADEVDDAEISRLSRIFNEDDKALTWEVTLGRHGMFATEEVSRDPSTDAMRTRMVGICSQHSAIQSENNLHPPSWMVSGQIAPKLGGNF